MKKLIRSVLGCSSLALVAGAVVACSGHTKQVAQEPTSPNTPLLVATGSSPDAEALRPPQVFQIRPHAPRRHASYSPPLELSRLPRLVDHVAGCFAPPPREPNRPTGLPSAPAPRGGGFGSGSGFGAGQGRLGSSSGGGAGGGPRASSPSGPALSGASGPEKKKRPAVSADSAPSMARPSAPATQAAPPAPAPMAAPVKAAAAPAEIAAAPRKAPGKDSNAGAASEREAGRRRDKSEEQVALPAEPPRPGIAPMPAVAMPPPPPAQPDPDERYHDWGQALYLSNDDTMSPSSAQRVIYAIDNGLPLPADHIRAHELLNYFAFETAAVDPAEDFSVLPGLVENPEQPGVFSLALAVKGWPLELASRRNVALSVVLDRSGSMQEEGRMDYLRRGLERMMGQLKPGDLLNFVIFDHEVCTPIENFVVGRDSPNIVNGLVRRLAPRGSTDLNAGLRRGYELADRDYQPTYSNRVLLITDALTNTGVTDEQLISMVSQHYDARRIRLSGIGVGRTFNDSLLNRLTERGKGAYVFLGSPAEVDAVFGSRFLSMVETTALDVHFQLHLPPSLRMDLFYGEEASTVKEEVQPIHYFANTSQLFLQDLMARRGKLRMDDTVMLTVEYEDPESGQEQLEDHVFRIGDIPVNSPNVRKGMLLMRFVDGLAALAPKDVGRGYSESPDPGAASRCEQGSRELETWARGLETDPEVRRVLGLWEKYCSRFPRGRVPVYRPGAGSDAWPGASD